MSVFAIREHKLITPQPTSTTIGSNSPVEVTLVGQLLWYQAGPPTKWQIDFHLRFGCYASRSVLCPTIENRTSGCYDLPAFNLLSKKGKDQEEVMRTKRCGWENGNSIDT
ncbi:hypothetical protein EVAR_91719_1 [Eumeta japonica]|uniref:Uncharacterized protein n=1 Tax=Eumeta variegata TaxID=151549 RepID=A0A4C1SW75_EUMVA|nr:hypothetical protein EVAR_91719_1 [Eumeta japonica]